MSNGFVCVMGIGTVFIGLICLIIITSIVGAVCKRFAKPETAVTAPANAPTAQHNANGAPIQNKQEIVAAVCAAIAEDLGEDVKNIKVTSFKKL